jgi:hypothetical protein
VLGDNGDGKSPGSDCILGEIVPVLENWMRINFPDQLREWQATNQFAEAQQQRWRKRSERPKKAGGRRRFRRCPSFLPNSLSRRGSCSSTDD